MTLSDALTGVGNRRFLDLELACYHWPFAVLFADVDHFKRINDAHGHDVGDEALRMIANTLALGSRGSDTVACYGGEEFIVVLPHADPAVLANTAHRLRLLVARSRLSPAGEPPIQLSISIGGTLVTPADTPDTLLRRADAAPARGQTRRPQPGPPRPARLGGCQPGSHQ